ncbi:MAG: hypothetical protein K2N34_11345 [Lachnospiraceae bacterium]|nr:hypothetical protein [Lachnospiraceae bacterium]
MGLLSYIKGNKKGREAHNLEREAMLDAFLADALDGYERVDDPELDIRLRRMEEKVDAGRVNRVRVRSRLRNYFYWISAACMLLLACTFSYELGTLGSEEECLSTYELGTLGSEEECLSTYEPAKAEMATRDSKELISEKNRQIKELKSEEEVVVTQTLLQQLPNKANISTSPLPSNGYKTYYEYIYKELGLSLKQGANTLKGIAVLSFTINEDGHPIDFKIIESTQPDVTNKLIDIIKKGDSWNNAGIVQSFVVIY